MEKLNLVQGSKEWKEGRLQNFTASEAPAMMGDSKYMSRNRLLKLKKTGNEEPISAHLQTLFDKGHETEALARRIVEDMIGEDLYPVTGILENTKYLASFDGLTFSNDINYEHKLWNETLAENIRNKVLEPQHYWQLEQQMLVSGAEKTIFVTSDGTSSKMVYMYYESIPERRLALIDGWNQFQIDLDEYEVEAIEETVIPAEVKSLPVVNYQLNGTDITSNIVGCLELITARSHSEMNRVLETDQDFADKDKLNKAVKTARADLKSLVEKVQGEFVSFAEFSTTAKEIDVVLQKMQSHGEKQVKDAKEAKKDEIFTNGDAQISDHIVILEKIIEPIRLTSLMNCTPDFRAAMKNKRTIESLQNAVDGVVADFKIEADQKANKAKENLLTLRDLAGDYKFLFSDTNQLVTKDNEDLIAVIKTRIADHEKAEESRLKKEREQIRIEEELKAKKKIEAEQRAAAVEEAERIAKEAAENLENEPKADVDELNQQESEQKEPKVEQDLPFVDQEDVPRETVEDHPETKEDIITNAFNDWSNSNKLVTPYVIRDLRLAFEAGAKWAISK